MEEDGGVAERDKAAEGNLLIDWNCGDVDASPESPHNYGSLSCIEEDGTDTSLTVSSKTCH